jgi:drug/metabolite transporter (DMT)-like permease
MRLSANAEVVASVVAYSLCSGSLVLVNKLCLYYLPYPSIVVTIQLWAALLFIQLGNAFNFMEVDPIIMRYVKPYLLYTVAFSLGVYCNMMSLSLSNVETVIVFRALAPLLVSIFDAMFLGREWPSLRSWGALSVIALGAYGYAMTDEQFQSQGVQAYFWPTLYLFVISFEMAYGKKITSGVDMKTLSGPVLYTNLLGWPPMLGFAAMGGEYRRIKNDISTRVMNGEEHLFPPIGIFLLFVGCIVGTGIGYSGWFCRSKVSFIMLSPMSGGMRCEFGIVTSTTLLF